MVAGGAVALSRAAGADGPFLVLAPLAPLGAVAAAFAPVADPGGEAGVATPLHGAGLVVRRTLAVLTVTFVALALAALALPNLSGSAAAWVLPGLALTLSALALATWTRIEVAVWSLGAGWLTAVTLGRWLVERPTAIDAVPLFTAPGQATAAAVAVAATAVLVARRDRLATLEAFR